ncbi:MAG TPA: glycosyltransferase family A protein [Candidatus Binatia bacterium]|nr:glycosyltransferase family A protein [Candidatus Binatia bacterium]
MTPTLPADTHVLRAAAVPRDRVRLSVIVPARDVAPWVEETVASLLGQTMPRLEVVVVDDGSSDDGLARVLGIADPRLACVAGPPRGLPAARNAGLAVARGEYVGFCDGDDVWFPEKAARHLAVMEADPTLGLTYSWSEYLAPGGARTGRLLLSRRREPTARQLARRNHVGNGSTPVVRRAAFDAAGPFDERFVCNFEDLEMWVRIAACTRFRVRLVPAALTGYRIRPGSLSVAFDGFLAGSRLAVECFRRYVPGFTARDAARVRAEALRIASRKAFANGDVVRSRRFLRAALAEAPTLAVSDPRAAGMIAVHLAALVLPPGRRQRAYAAAEHVLRAVSLLVAKEARR